MAFANDVFISYSSADRAWAERLAADLKARGLRAFFDRESLQLGQRWRDQLKAELDQSRHLVCLWSAKAQASEWVNYELFRFSAMLESPDAKDRLMLFVNLDGSTSLYGDLQQIAEAPLTAAYAAGLATLAEADWRAMADRIDAAVRRDPLLLSVPVALLTLTRAQCDEIAPKKIAKVAERLGLDAAALPERYGADRLDWRPYGSGPSIGALMDDVRARLNQRLAPRTVQWQLPGESFWDWADGAPAQAFANAMQHRRLGAIVIDPVALADETVQQRLGMFTECLHEESIAILVMPPVGASEQDLAFRRWVRDTAAAIVKPYFEPPLDPATRYRVRCGIGPDDASEMQRLLQSGIGQFIRASRPEYQPANAFTGN